MPQRSRIVRSLFLVASLALFATEALAVQVYSIYSTGCKQLTGAIVHVDETNVTVLSLQGAVKKLPIADVALVARFDVLENPFTGFARRSSWTSTSSMSSRSISYSPTARSRRIST